MDYIDLLVNIICFGLLCAFVPGGIGNQPHPPAIESSPMASPRSAKYDHLSFDPLALPTISLTPDQPAAEFQHKRKSVSFSLSSMADIQPRDVRPKAHKRPPTPFVRAPTLPYMNEASSLSSAPTTPLPQNVEFVDPMGVQKRWLMP